jgi:glycosyltransferase involved in cell wall biosynthesis
MTRDATKLRKVLLIIDSYPPVLGGSEIEAQRVSAGLIRRGHKVQVICAGGLPMPPVRKWIDPEGVPVRILTRRSRGRWRDAVFAARVAWAIWRERNRYDIVYFLMQGLHLAAGLPIARVLRKPMVMKIGGSTVIPLMRQSRAGRWELNWLQQWKIPVMVLNEGMIDEALADGFTRDQLVWMPNPVDVDVFRPARAEEAAEWRAHHNIPLEANVAIYVGRLSSEKGLHPLLRGFSVAAREVPDAILVLLGDGALRPELEKLARDLSLTPQQIRFAGRVPIEEVPRWLRASDVYALTSPSEGFSCALLEAMSVGLPSVVSAIPANLQLIDDGVHGITVTWDDERALRAAFLRLFGNRELRKRMGKTARERVVKNYATDQVLDRYETLFSDLMRRRRDHN